MNSTEAQAVRWIFDDIWTLLWANPEDHNSWTIESLIWAIGDIIHMERVLDATHSIGYNASVIPDDFVLTF